MGVAPVMAASTRWINELDAFKVSQMKFRVVIDRDEDGVFVAEVPTLPGCIAQGSTRAEALQNAREAVAAYLQSLEARGDPIPPPLRHVSPPHRRLVIPDHDPVAKGTLRAVIREADPTVEEFVELL